MVMSYEECRRLRLEENRKRLEALNLPQLSRSLSLSPKPSPMKQTKPRTPQKQLVAVRRSNRFTNNPSPVYVEVSVDRLEITRRIIFNKGRMDLANRVYASDEARAYATGKAEEVQSGLEPNYPSFVKPMLQSHVTGGFWLGLPSYFTRRHLSKRDEIMTLVDEEGEEYQTIYLALKSGLSGGWRGFAIAHNLVDGDALVFQLIRPTKMKVYIVRVSSFEEGKKGE